MCGWVSHRWGWGSRSLGYIKDIKMEHWRERLLFLNLEVTEICIFYCAKQSSKLDPPLYWILYSNVKTDCDVTSAMSEIKSNCAEIHKTRTNLRWFTESIILDHRDMTLRHLWRWKFIGRMYVYIWIFTIFEACLTNTRCHFLFMPPPQSGFFL